jgi:hypothetical protein
MNRRDTSNQVVPHDGGDTAQAAGEEVPPPGILASVRIYIADTFDTAAQRLYVDRSIRAETWFLRTDLTIDVHLPVAAISGSPNESPKTQSYRFHLSAVLMTTRMPDGGNGDVRSSRPRLPAPVPGTWAAASNGNASTLRTRHFCRNYAEKLLSVAITSGFWGVFEELLFGSAFLRFLGLSLIALVRIVGLHPGCASLLTGAI